MQKLNHILLLLMLALTTLPLISCHKEDDEDESVKSHDKVRMTVVVYMAAENSLTKYVNSDINEMVRACGSVPLDCNYIIYLDDNTVPHLYLVTAQGGKTEYRTLTERNSADGDIFRQTMSEILTDFPADHYGLVMWSHASGWIPAPKKTIGLDNNINSSTLNDGSEMEIADFHQALAGLGVHWDYIFFDACFMQCIESDYELHDVTDYLIASPAEIPGRGAPYDSLMTSLTHEANDSVITALVDGYYNAYATGNGLEISAVKTSELDSLLSVTRRLLPNYYTEAPLLSTSNLQPYCIYNTYSIWKPEYYDVGSVMYNMLNASDYNEWRAQLERTVFCRRSTLQWHTEYPDFIGRIIDPEHVATASIFVPNAKYDANTTYNEKIKETAWYKAFTMN